MMHKRSNKHETKCWRSKLLQQKLKQRRSKIFKETPKGEHAESASKFVRQEIETVVPSSFTHPASLPLLVFCSKCFLPRAAVISMWGFPLNCRGSPAGCEGALSRTKLHKAPAATTVPSPSLPPWWSLLPPCVCAPLLSVWLRLLESLLKCKRSYTIR